MDAVQARILARRDTTENWNQHRDFIPMRGEICVYTDHGQIDDGYGNMIDVPGIKIGDGSAYLIDLPFVGNDVRYEIMTELRRHENDTDVHVTLAEKQFWNNKLNYTIDDGVLTLTRN